MVELPGLHHRPSIFALLSAASNRHDDDEEEKSRSLSVSLGSFTAKDFPPIGRHLLTFTSFQARKL